MNELVIMLKAHEFSKAKRLLQKRLEEQSDDVYLLTQMANVLWNLGKDEEALLFADKALKVNSVYPLLIYTRGQILWSLERFEESIEMWNILLHMDFLDVSGNEFGNKWAKSVVNDALFYKADCLYCLYRKTEAKECLLEHMAHRRKGQESDFTIKECRDFLRILEFSSDNPDTNSMDVSTGYASSIQSHRIEKHIKELASKKDWTQLIRYLKRKCEEFPKEYWFKTELAEYLYLEGNKACLRYAKEAFDIAPDDMLVVYNYAYSLYINERYEEAENALMIIREKGLDYIAYSEHGEGMRWAKKLMQDTEKLLEKIKMIRRTDTVILRMNDPGHFHIEKR